MKRNFWKKNEVKCMLKVFKDLNIVQLLEQKTLPINDIYKRIEYEMAQRGCKKKNAKQIQSKWSQMKSAYLCVKRNHKADFYKTKDPEFRDEVAELVEVEMETSATAIPLRIPSIPPSTSSRCSSAAPTTIDPIPIVEIKPEPLDEDEEDAVDDDMPIHEPEVRPDFSKNRVFMPPTIDDENPFKQGSYKKSFWKFMQQLKSLEVDLQEEFIMKQSRLMSHEHKLQVQRDNIIIASFAANTNLILKTTQELVEKGFHR